MATSFFRSVSPRDPSEPHRVATPLELFFDLVFVVAIAQAATGLHHAIAEHHAIEGLLKYAQVFFAIWWAWMNFTWFASAYDNDDVAYRLLVFVQLTGALILAAGVAPAFDRLDFRVVVLGYVVMRLALVTQWLRVAVSDPPRRRTALRYASAIALIQVLWVLTLTVPYSPILALIGVFAELCIPAWAERSGTTPWHPHHIAERYGLLTIIVLGEAILAASIAVQAATHVGAYSATLASVIVGGLLIVFTLWWIYFEYPTHDLLGSMRTGFLYGYGHFVIYASAAAVGAGMAVAVDQAVGKAQISQVAAGAAVAVPVAVCVLSMWCLHIPLGALRSWRGFLAPTAAVTVLLTPFLRFAVLWAGLILLVVNAVVVLTRPKARHAGVGGIVVSASLAAWVAPASAFSNGPPDHFAGNPPARATCVTCHNSFPLNAGDGHLELLGVPAVPHPDSIYALTVRLSDSGQARWGFQMTVLNDQEEMAGELRVIDFEHTRLSDNSGAQADFIKQTANGTYAGTSGPGAWQFECVAGPEPHVTFYVAGNAANNDATNQGDYIYSLELEAGGTTAVDLAWTSPSVAVLHPASPNPAHAGTRLRFAVHAHAHWSLRVFDVSGRQVAILLDEVLGIGDHAVVWSGLDLSGRPLPSGVYYYRLTGASWAGRGRLILAR